MNRGKEIKIKQTIIENIKDTETITKPIISSNKRTVIEAFLDSILTKLRGKNSEFHLLHLHEINISELKEILGRPITRKESKAWHIYKKGEEAKKIKKDKRKKRRLKQHRDQESQIIIDLNLLNLSDIELIKKIKSLATREKETYEIPEGEKKGEILIFYKNSGADNLIRALNELSIADFTNLLEILNKLDEAQKSEISDEISKIKAYYYGSIIRTCDEKDISQLDDQTLLQYLVAKYINSITGPSQGNLKQTHIYQRFKKLDKDSCTDLKNKLLSLKENRAEHAEILEKYLELLKSITS